MSQLDYMVAQSMAREREHNMQTALRRRHHARSAPPAATAVAVHRHRREHHWLHDALVHLHLAHAQPQPH